ncbi:hypothetical protein COE00_20675, partial [Bacillus cereus]
ASPDASYPAQPPGRSSNAGASLRESASPAQTHNHRSNHLPSRTHQNTVYANSIVCRAAAQERDDRW